MTARTDIHPLNETHIDEAVALLTRTFFDYPMWQWVLPDEERRRRALPIAMRASVIWGLLMGESFGLNDPLRAIAIWAPPGMADADLDPDGSKTDWNNVVAAIGPDGIRRFDAMIEVQRPLRVKHMGATGWYLPWLGVDPAAQRTGAGTALLSAMFQRLDADGASAYHETEHAVNVPYYIKQGYQVVHQGLLPDNGPEYWCFLRTPKK